jgi:hypothetical protein
MPLSEAATTVTKPKAGGVCSIRLLLARLDPADRVWLTERLMQPVSAVQNSWLSRVLAEDGHRVQAQTIARHRRRDCECP